MEEEEGETAGNYCASCNSPIPPGEVVCSKCLQVRVAGKKPSEAYDRTLENVSVLKTPEESVRRSVAYGMLTEEQGELLVLLLSRSRLLDFSVRFAMTSLVKEIAEERNAQRKEDRIIILIEFVSVTMPSEDLAGRLSRAFKTR